jgi:hypothetical protein
VIRRASFGVALFFSLEHLYPVENPARGEPARPCPPLRRGIQGGSWVQSCRGHGPRIDPPCRLFFRGRKILRWRRPGASSLLRREQRNINKRSRGTHRSRSCHDEDARWRVGLVFLGPPVARASAGGRVACGLIQPSPHEPETRQRFAQVSCASLGDPRIRQVQPPEPGRAKADTGGRDNRRWFVDRIQITLTLCLATSYGVQWHANSAGARCPL